MNTFLAPPPSAAMPQPATDPVALLEALKALAGTQIAPPEPMYPAWYRPPAKPDHRRIKADADVLAEDNAQWRYLVWRTLQWIRGDLRGVFEEDREARENGFQDEYPSPALADERNLIVSKLASYEEIYKKRVVDDNLRARVQEVIDAAYWMREQFNIAHTQMGNRPLRLDEASMFTDYGMIVSRRVLDPTNPEMPIDRTLIDPATVNPIWAGRRGLKAVYRTYRDTLENVCGDYGDVTKSAYRVLESKYGKSKVRDGRCEVNVTEYWDTWWRCVLVDDQIVVPVTAHEYGEVPFTIQYGGMGEPMFTRTPGTPSARIGNHGEVLVSGSLRSEERINKAVPLIYYSIPRHELFESVMARVLFAFKRETDPPFFRKRSLEAGNRPLPEVDGTPGAQNELMEDESIVPWPQQVGGSASQMLMTNMGIDRATNQSPMAAYGSTGDKSNVSGAGLDAAASAGADKVAPHVMAYTRFLANDISGCLRLIRNHGDVAKYQGASPVPLMVPRRRTRTGDAPAFELDRDLLDQTGTTVECEMSQLNPRDWLQLFQSGKLGVDAGFIVPRTISELAGVHDYDRMQEEWFEEQTLRQAFQHPKFAEMFSVPAAIAEQIAESEGNPEAQAGWQKALDAWMQIVAMAAQQQGGMPGQGGAPAAPPPPTGGPMPPSNGPPGPPPGSELLGPAAGAAGVSMPGLGQGPGINGGAVGRPPGA